MSTQICGTHCPTNTSIKTRRVSLSTFFRMCSWLGFLLCSPAVMPSVIRFFLLFLASMCSVKWGWQCQFLCLHVIPYSSLESWSFSSQGVASWRDSAGSLFWGDQCLHTASIWVMSHCWPHRSAGPAVELLVWCLPTVCLVCLLLFPWICSEQPLLLILLFSYSWKAVSLSWLVVISFLFFFLAGTYVIFEFF
jgi:hypothetical protein